jgi:polyphenol oxidase
LSDAARGTVPAAAPPLPDGIARVREERVAGSVPLFAHPGWRRDLEWLVQGTTGHGRDLLTVSIADCVPISLVDSSSRRIALLHGGWRGTALGILGAGLAHLGGDPSAVHVHLGPAICGRCYEVGPEVHQALGLAVPAAPAPVDVRAVLARQAVDAGVAPGHISVSEHCTRCGDNFFSHRAGSPGRQLGVLGLRP